MEDVQESNKTYEYLFLFLFAVCVIMRTDIPKNKRSFGGERKMFFITEAHTGRKVTIIYEAKSGRISKRTIHVLAVKKDHVLAYCYLRNGVRSFRKQNILAFEIKRNRKEQLL